MGGETLLLVGVGGGGKKVEIYYAQNKYKISSVSTTVDPSCSYTFQKLTQLCY